MFKKYKRKAVAELRPVTIKELEASAAGLISNGISISSENLNTGSPLPNDMIARNPKNHYDQWLVTAKYFKDNFEEV